MWQLWTQWWWLQLELQSTQCSSQQTLLFNSHLIILLLLRDRLVGLSRLPITHHPKSHLAAEHENRQNGTHSRTNSHQHETSRERLLRQVLIGQRRKLLQWDSPWKQYLHLSVKHTREARARREGLILKVLSSEGLQRLQLTGTLVGGEFTLSNEQTK